MSRKSIENFYHNINSKEIWNTLPSSLKTFLTTADKEKILAELKEFENKILKGDLEADQLEQIFKTIAQNHNYFPTYRIATILLIIANHFLEIGLEDTIKNFEKILGQNLETFFNKILQLKNETVSDINNYLKIIIGKNYQVFVFNTLTKRINTNEDKHQLIKQIEEILTRQINHLENLPSDIQDIELARLTNTVISYGNYYYTILQALNHFSQYQYPDKLDKFLTESFSYLKSLSNDFHILEQLPLKSLIVILGNLYIAKSYIKISHNIPAPISSLERLKKHILQIINTKYKKDLQAELESQTFKIKFLHFYAGIQFEKNSDGNFILKELNKNINFSLKNFIENNFSLQTLKNLKISLFKNVENFYYILHKVLPEETKDQLEKKSIPFHEYQNTLINHWEKLLTKPLPGRSIKHFKNFIEFVFDISVKDIQFFVKSPTEFTLLNIKFNKIQHIQHIDDDDIITDNYFDIKIKNNILYITTTEGIIKITTPLIDETLVKNRINFLNNIIKIFSINLLKKLDDYMKDLNKLEDILSEEIGKKHEETFKHLHNTGAIIFYFLRQPLIYEKLYPILEYLEEGYMIDIRQLSYLLGYIHDIGKARINLHLYDNLHKNTHLILYNLILDLLNKPSTPTDSVSSSEINIKQETIPKELYSVILTNLRKLIETTPIFKRNIDNLRKDIEKLSLDKLFNEKIEKIKQTAWNIFNNHQILIINNIKESIAQFYNSTLPISIIQKDNLTLPTIFSKNSIKRIRENLGLQPYTKEEELITSFLLFLLAYIDCLVKNLIKNIQQPHVTEGLKIIENELPSFKPLAFSIFHHPYPDLKHDFINIIKSISEFLDNFNLTKENAKFLKEAIDDISHLGKNVSIPRSYKDRDPLTIIITIADLIEALHVGNRSYQIQEKNTPTIPASTWIQENSFNQIITPTNSIPNFIIPPSFEKTFNKIPFYKKCIKPYLNLPEIKSFVKNENPSDAILKIKKKKISEELQELLLDDIIVIIGPGESLNITQENNKYYIKINNKWIYLPYEIIDNLKHTYKFTTTYERNKIILNNTSTKFYIINLHTKRITESSGSFSFIKKTPIFNLEEKNPWLIIHEHILRFQKNSDNIFKIRPKSNEIITLKNLLIQDLPISLKLEKIHLHNCVLSVDQNSEGKEIYIPFCEHSKIEGFGEINIGTLKNNNFVSGNDIKINFIQSPGYNFITGENIEINNIKSKAIIKGTKNITLINIESPLIIILDNNAHLILGDISKNLEDKILILHPGNAFIEIESNIFSSQIKEVITPPISNYPNSTSDIPILYNKLSRLS